MGLIGLREARGAEVGGKAAPLATLLRAGFDVPEGFVVTAEEDRGAPAVGLAGKVEHCLRTLFDGGVIGPVAVRSSAGHEDGQTSSAAGMHETFLAVQGIDEVMAAIVRCRESLDGQAARAYLSRFHPDEPSSAMAVLVQEFVEADLSGVLFAGQRCQVEATWGLGPTLVEGRATPDSWTVDRGRITDHRRGSKEIRCDRSDGRVSDDRLVWRDLPVDDRAIACLNDEQVLALARVGQQVRDLLGHPCDIEWAMVDGRIRILQARPITAPLPDARSAAVSQGVSDTDGALVLTGVPGSSGIASGRLQVVTGPSDFAHFRRGDVLVCRHTDPAWTPLLMVAAAVVTEVGGVLSHAAIVARELRIPAVLGVPGAMRLRSESSVTVDGDRGTVTRR